MTKFCERYCTQYENHPLINPDFIYIDGPDQFEVKKNINNFTVNSKSMMPMLSDVLKYEHFLTPGTISDVSWNALAYDGLKAVEKEFPVKKVNHIESKTPAQWEEHFCFFCHKCRIF